MKQEVFNIKAMSKFTLLTEAEIKFFLNIPLDAACTASTIQEAKNAYNSAETNEKIMAALKQWVNLFIIETQNVDLEKALELKEHIPPDCRAELAYLKMVAYLHGFTDDYPNQILFHRVGKLTEAIEIAFKEFNNLSENWYLGPKGKLKIKRHNGGPRVTEEIYVQRVEDGQKDRLLFIAYNYPDGYQLSDHWEGEPISKWNELW